MPSATAIADDDRADSGAATIAVGGKTITIQARGAETSKSVGPDGVTTTVTNEDGSTETTVVGPRGEVTSTTTSDGGHRDFVGYDSHRGWNGPPAWVVIVALLIVASIVKSAIRARAGDTRTRRERRADRRAGRDGAGAVGAGREAELLAAENERLRAQVVRMEERVAVLERIVTDPAKRVSEEIERLR